MTPIPILVFLAAGFFTVTSGSASSLAAPFESIPLPEGGRINRLVSTRTHEFALGQWIGFRRPIGDSTWTEFSHPWATWFNVFIGTQGDTLVMQTDTSKASYSLDQGSTWKSLPPPSSFGSTAFALVYIGNGGILCRAPLHSRNQTGLFLSTDFGKSWSGPFLSTEAPGSVVLWKDAILTPKYGEGLIRFDPSNGIRSPFVDDGKLDSCTSIVLHGDSAILLAHCQGEGRLYRLMEDESVWQLIQDDFFSGGIVRIRGNTLVAGIDLRSFEVPGPFDTAQVRLSDDLGQTWRKNNLSGYRLSDLLPVSEGVLLGDHARGVARLGRNAEYVRGENSGISINPIYRLALTGRRIIAIAQTDHSLALTDNLGEKWRRRVVPEKKGLEPVLFQSVDGVSLWKGDSIISLSDPGVGIPSFRLPSPPPTAFSMVPGGNRVYVAGGRDNANSDGYSYRIQSAEMGTWNWTSGSSPPIIPLGLAADNRNLLIHDERNAFHSTDAGVSWVEMKAAPFRIRNAHAADGKFLVGSDRGIYRADIPTRTWLLAGLEGSDTPILAGRGDTLVVWRNGVDVRYTPDAGATWQDIALPFPGRSLVAFRLSDQLACVEGATHPATNVFYCSEAETLPLAIRKPVWKQVGSRARTVFTGTRMEIRLPGRNGAGGAVNVKGQPR